MVGTNHEKPGKHTPGKTSLFGLVSYQPRWVIVLLLLTLTVSVVGLRISWNSGLRRVDALVQDAERALAIPTKVDPAGPRDPAEVEAKIREWTGAKIVLPRDEQLFTYNEVAREKMGRLPVVVVRLSFSGEPYLLLVVRKEMIRGSRSPGSLFSQSGFLSGEKDGKSYVFWEREGVSYLVVTGAELEHAFDLVRRYFT
jgi:hypothetical protein